MKGVFSQQNRPLDQIAYVAIAIAEPSPDQRHTGVFYRVNPTDQIQFLHLAWHCDLRRHRPSPTYHWINLRISPRRLKQVAAICDDIASANLATGIPYSFGSPQNCFDDRTGEFLLGPTNTGLTCASFVLAVFERAGLRLVQIANWPPPNDEDKRWQGWAVRQLQQYEANSPGSVSPQHIQSVQHESRNSARFRPEQVAAAGLKRKRRPVTFTVASRFGRAIVALIRNQSYVGELNLWDRLLNYFGR